LIIIKGFKFIIKSFFNLLKIVLSYPGRWLSFIFYRIIILNLYKLLLILKKVINAALPEEKVIPFYLFINKYIYHLAIIILVLIVAFTNMVTPETKAEGFGEKSILYALATGNNPEDQYIEESISPSPAAANYLNNESAAVSRTPQVSNDNSAPETNPISTTTEGSAIFKPEVASMQSAQKYRGEVIDYTVIAGDTIESIAENYDISPETIYWENNLSKNSIIRPGQKLKILPTTGLEYKIVKGDNLDKIAKKFKADKEKIIEFNTLANESDISVGQILIIPEGQPYNPPTQLVRLAPLQQIFQQIPEEALNPEGKMLWPNGCRRITQYFSWHHTGVDIACNAGTPIRAADDGIVSQVLYRNTGYGHSVDIDHGGGKMTRYGHMTEIYVKPGQSVQRGQVIGIEGSTGHSTGPHLHFEVRFFNKVYNPLNYIR